MANAFAIHPGAHRKGVSLVELSFVVIFIGVLAAFAAPQMLQTVERNKASKSFKYLGIVRAAQERYLEKQGTYAADLAAIDLQHSAPKHFHVGTISAGETGSLLDSWSLTLTRSSSSTGYGSYSVTFTQDGYDSNNSTIESEINPQSS